MKKVYPWPRFWSPQGAELTLFSNAYLPDPEDAYARFHNQNVSTFKAMSAEKCNVLLGDGGMGKSRSLDRDHRELGLAWDSQNEHGALIDLGRLSGYGDLDVRLNENAAVQKWRKGDGILHLTLDSLDEALPSLPNLPKVLLGVLESLPKDRLRFSIACRSVLWSPFLGDGLKDLFGPDAVRPWRLAPLRHEDVRVAAAMNGLDGDAFLRAVADKKVEAMAAHPLTLDLLLRSVSGGIAFPDDLTQLYERGCKTFLLEPPDSSRAARPPRMDADQMMAVAGRIACMTLFGATTAVETNEVDACPEGAVRVGNVAGGSETVRGAPFEVGTLAVREVISSGLFTRAGSQYRWIHKSFAEFLAAYHLRGDGTSLSQIRKLLLVAGQIAPALSGVAAWLAGMRDDVLTEILQIDPEVLLEADLSKCAASVQAELVEFLFRQAEAESPFVYQWGLFWKLKKLNHPGLKAQLEPRLDASKPKAVRKLAVEVANACGGAGLLGKLVDIALDGNEQLFLRIDAAAWMSEHATSGEKDRLRPLALKAGGDKDEQRIQAYALAAVWSSHATWQEVRDSVGLRDYPQTDALGRFLAHDFIEGLSESDFADALRWLAQKYPNPDALSGWAGAADQLILRAMNRMDDAVIRTALADLLAARITIHHMVFDSRGASSKKEGYVLGPAIMRRLLASELVPRLGGKTPVGWLLLRDPAPLLLESDLEFAIDEWKTAVPAIGPNWESIVGALTNWDIAEARSKVYSLTADRPDLKAALKAWYANRRRFKKSEDSRQAKDRRKSERARSIRIRTIQDLVSECERDPRSIPRLLWLMSAKLDSDMIENPFHPNLRELPGWSVLTTAEADRIIGAAKRFLALEPSYTAKTLRCGGHSPHTLAAYKIIRDLMVHEPGYARALPAGVLSKWIPSILLYQASRTDKELDGTDDALRELGRSTAPAVLRFAAALILRRGGLHNPERVLKWLSCERQSPGLDRILLKIVNRPTTPENLYIGGLRTLFERGSQDAEKLAQDQLKLATNTGAGNRRAASSCAVWIEQRRERAWREVWPVMKANGDFAKAVLEVMSSNGTIAATLGAWLPETECLDMYRWLRAMFGAPPNSDPFQRDIVHTVQGNILHWLQERLTAEAVASLEQLDREYPGDWWIRKAAWEARRGLVQKSWQLLEPATVRRVIEDRRHLLVRDEKELMEDLLETLSELQTKLHNTGDRVRRLWNEYHSGRTLACKPKPEEPVSREIASELMDLLRRRGVTATLETKIREGEYVDIHVAATTASSPSKSVSLVIEVKGCWNPGVKTSLDAQLAQRYLKDNQSPYGIYLVVWFTCDAWDDRDANRKAQASKETLKGLTAFLKKKASRVSREHGISIKSFVLDATLRGRPQKKVARKSAKRQAAKRTKGRKSR